MKTFVKFALGFLALDAAVGIVILALAAVGAHG